ncbi:universal stress protein [Natronobacterium gregoryi]|uniref:Universal stress family protein n=2 Tax=Natronobacterium gregoryi TaxID=44930 RepID=L0AIX0_NATGS|nr:universal stress protein [Natronobacterium gregoryi]AFZ73092.1 universal stress family protein [Natronobacterium gregoryi SP2]ELY70809.1 UspA domain-containing protein [Natronobacterium gregoryi SP2]PLK20388.1 universal stress protein [Natronobacterium gregoryi SP2]SFI61346.1 Universal stress protein family protein [Natronobacterium gregoryi]
MNVLMGLGGSDQSIKTLRRTISRTEEVGDDLTIAILEKPESKRSQEEMRDRTVAVLAESDVDAEIVTLEGDPGSALVDYAEQGEFDQLVIGGGTLSPMGKIQLGPITEFVLLNAPTTVKLVR